MNTLKMRSWLIAGAIAVSTIAVSTIAVGAQSSEGSHMVLSATNQSCLQLKDDNTWTNKTTWANAIATGSNLAAVLADTNNNAVELTSSTHPPAVGYGNGMRWASGDMSTGAWIPQGETNGSSGTKNYAIVSWHWNTDNYAYNNGSRVSIVDTTDLTTATYRNVILINPTSATTWTGVNIHVGGITVIGTYLYVADTSHGFRVFDLNNIRNTYGDADLCKNADGSGFFGTKSGHACAAGYGYALPQIGSYTMPSTKEDGTAISAACKPKFSWAGKDTRPSTDQVLSGEYCAPTTTTTDGNNCEGVLNGLNGRLYQWPVGSGSKLATSAAGYVSPTKAYYMNERNIQGVAPDLVSGAATDSYWLSSTKSSGIIFKVTPAANAKSWSYSNSLSPYHPEGMHATSTGHLWIVTEGNGGSNTNPATGGRVLIYLQQSAIN